MALREEKLEELVRYVHVKSSKIERQTMRTIRRKTCLLAMMFSATCFSGEIVYQDYLAESDLLSEQDHKANAWILTHFDWNYFFESNSLAVAMKIKYETEDETNLVFRPIVVRYDFNGIHEPVEKSICRAGTCFPGVMPTGFCMVGLDSFLFSYGQWACPKTSFMHISDSTQAVVDISSDVNGLPLRGALSNFERATFPNGEGYAFQCAKGKTNNWGLLLWNRGVGGLRPVASRLKGYTCLSGGRVLIDAPIVETGDSSCKKVAAYCYRVLPDGDINAVPNVYADWDVVLSNKIILMGKDSLGRPGWSIDLHGMKERTSDNELGHDFVEGQGVIYDFSRWRIFRIRKNDSDWQTFDLREFFSEDITQAKNSVPMSVLHRGAHSWYYAILFEYEKLPGDGKQRYRIRIVEVSRKGGQTFLWLFPDFYTAKKLTTYELRSPGVVHKLQDDSWVFVSNTCTFTNDALFVQRMTGSKEAIQPAFKLFR